ncbi:MAG: polysaccharide deacetylase family protein [Myxococcales bacterium]|nr:polysaccharide deacetylase family protein [Myxococcota bacterium]MDW8282032.1 polysaccharide deacetylase family protein [Myxococcales bacterium]
MRRLRTAVRQALLAPVGRSGLPAVLQRLVFRHGLTIVAYHGLLCDPLPVPDWCFLDEQDFRQQVSYLGQRFLTLPLEEAVERLQSGRLHRPAVAITFDDGFQSVHDLALPILRTMGLPATVFLNTGLCGTEDTVWFCRLHRALCRTGRREVRWRGVRLDLRDVHRRKSASVVLQAQLKELAHDEMLAETRRLVQQLGDDPDEAVPPGSPYRMLSREAIATMVSSGVFSFGAHTHSHAILTRVSTERGQQEVLRSVDSVAALTGRPCRSFAYPNGRRQDYDHQTISLLRSLGVRLAVTSVPGPNVFGTPVLELCRYGIGHGTSMAHFRCLVHHMMHLS